MPEDDFTAFTALLPGFQPVGDNYAISCTGPNNFNFPSIQIYFAGDPSPFIVDETVYRGAQLSQGVCDLLLAPENMGDCMISFTLSFFLCTNK